MTDPSADDRAMPGKADADGPWQISGMSPKAVATAREAARRARVPVATWLAGLIHAVADHEDADRDAPDGPDAA